MLAVSGGSLMMLSTPYGKRGVFYEEWTGGHGWERYEVPASQCPRISEDFLEEERAASLRSSSDRSTSAPSRRPRIRSSPPT